LILLLTGNEKIASTAKQLIETWASDKTKDYNIYGNDLEITEEEEEEKEEAVVDEDHLIGSTKF
jgi:hypothetical protein